MVPVRLELQNFLSYGTDAPPLEFDAFDVACLSGKNGQGKSALLDAITWAVWGEARKSSGRRKPDEELIRIGTRHMEVAFTFDLEDERYRVTRTFTRSSTGKTTQSDLEFQLYEPDGGAYRPLTGPTQRETQERIDDTLGLSYDTFINSAFLLQGRSDEFTKKRPSERKEILANILNLSRYEALRRKASDRWRDAKQRVQRAASDIERLEEAVADVPEWKEHKAEMETKVEAQQSTLATLREEERTLTEQRADLEAKAREAESVKASLQNVDTRIEQHRDAIENLERRIREANALLDRRAAIQERHERYQALQEERDALDEKRDLHRGLEKQIEQKRSALKERRNELERTLDRLKVERKGFQQSLRDMASKLAQRAAVTENLKAAQAARQRKEEMEAVRDQRESVRDEMASLERKLIGQRQQIQGELDALRSQIESEEEAVSGAQALAERVHTLADKQAKRQKLADQQERIEKKGKQVAEALQEKTGQLNARREEQERQQDVLERVRSLDQNVCPTCGTELTAEHRDEVESSLQHEIDDLQTSIRRIETKREQLSEQRADLRRRYAEVRDRLEALNGVPEKLAAAREQVRSHRETARTLHRHRQEADALARRLQEKAYGTALRTRRQALKERLRSLHLDNDEYQRVQSTAAQVERYKERLRELEELEGRKSELERKIDSHDKQIAEIRQKLDDGTAFGRLPDEIESLERQLDQIGFDPERFAEVRRGLQDLSDAGAEMKDLVNAQSNREEWTARKEQLQKQIEEEKEEREELQVKLEALQKELEGTEALKEKLEAKSEAVQDAESRLNELQQRLGKLTERLETAADNREKLEAARDRRAEAEHDRSVYKHLRTAFGKHGIPSLIIEETLPEIEERANVLLDRLTNGKMHVRLETLKEKKTGGTKETLEIIITDEQGVARPYETFSGGESFRVNFALRIALAQLLAERSGVRVRTLVIDEGFGTQDQQGIERLVEAIQTIREDFAKILVITHLERLKQAFPVRIEVEKDPAQGSSFEMIGA